MKFDESVKYLYSLGNEVEAMKLGSGEYSHTYSPPSEILKKTI